MRVKETKVYKYAELSDKAKAKARDWYREGLAGDNFFAEYATESFLEELAALGFTVDAERGLSWSGFSSQGDGASFAGTWYASDCAPGKLLANRPPRWPAESGGQECPSNVELHRIAGEILACRKAGLSSAIITASHRGFFMSLDDARNYDAATDTDNDATAELGERLLEAARDLAHAFYKTLEAEYEYVHSDEAVAESIEANEYEFTEHGELA